MWYRADQTLSLLEVQVLNVTTLGDDADQVQTSSCLSRAEYPRGYRRRHFCGVDALKCDTFAVLVSHSRRIHGTGIEAISETSVFLVDSVLRGVSDERLYSEDLDARVPHSVC